MTDHAMVNIQEIYLESDPNQGNMVFLKEGVESDHYLVMFVGDSEFGAIAKEKGLVQPKRPLTHDLYLSIMDQLEVEFVRVEISELREDTYYANVLFRARGKEYSVDSRPSDAVALALRRKIPIMVRQSLLRRNLSQEEIEEYEGLIKTVKF